MGLVIALIVLVIIAGGVIWFVVNRATTGKGGRHGGSTSEISGAHEGAAQRPSDDGGEARPVVGGEAEAERQV
jgi:hypothetical protein